MHQLRLPRRKPFQEFVGGAKNRRGSASPNVNLKPNAAVSILKTTPRNQQLPIYSPSAVAKPTDRDMFPEASRLIRLAENDHVVPLCRHSLACVRVAVRIEWPDFGCVDYCGHRIKTNDGTD